MLSSLVATTRLFNLGTIDISGWRILNVGCWNFEQEVQQHLWPLQSNVIITHHSSQLQ